MCCSQQGTRFSNMMQHFEQKLKQEVMNLWEMCDRLQPQKFLCLLYISKPRGFYGCTLLDINCLQLCSVVQDAEFREHLNYQSLSLNTFKNYLLLLTKCTELNTANALSVRIALVIDGHLKPMPILLACLRLFRLSSRMVFNLRVWLYHRWQMRWHRMYNSTQSFFST